MISEALLLYYITDRTQFPGDEGARRRALLKKIAEAARCGVDFIQLRDKDLSARELESLAQAAIAIARENSLPGSGHSRRRTRFLINSRTDVAISCGADGVHLPADDISPAQVIEIWKSGGARVAPVVTVSCHSPAEVARAGLAGASFALLAPVFEKKDAPQLPLAGLAGLRQACQERIPVIALGGVTTENAKACVDAGAAGIAAIRLFQDNDIAEVVRHLRG